MPQNIAGIDVHKKLLVVIIADPAKPDVVLQSRRFGTGSAELQHLSAWLCQYGVEKAVMKSTAQLETGLDGTGAAHAAVSGAGTLE